MFLQEHFAGLATCSVCSLQEHAWLFTPCVPCVPNANERNVPAGT